MPLGHLTTIVMPHKSGKLNLRSRNKKTTVQSQTTNPDTIVKKTPDFHSMTPIQILKHGLESNLYKKPGWLAKLLIAEGK